MHAPVAYVCSPTWLLLVQTKLTVSAYAVPEGQDIITHQEILNKEG